MYLNRLLEPTLFSSHGTEQHPLSEDIPVPTQGSVPHALVLYAVLK